MKEAVHVIRQTAVCVLVIARCQLFVQDDVELGGVEL
jgi:hypothetical protein